MLSKKAMEDAALTRKVARVISLRTYSVARMELAAAAIFNRSL